MTQKLKDWTSKPAATDHVAPLNYKVLVHEVPLLLGLENSKNENRQTRYVCRGLEYNGLHSSRNLRGWADYRLVNCIVWCSRTYGKGHSIRNDARIRS